MAGGVPTIPGRRIAGFFKILSLHAVFGVGAAAVLFGCLVLLKPLLNNGPTLRDVFPDWWFVGSEGSVYVLVMAGILLCFWLLWRLDKFVESPVFRKGMADWTADNREWKQQEAYGKGGSAGFGGLLDEWDNLFAKDDVLIGRSMHDNSLIGLNDPRGLLTIASSRSGKGRSAIIPNLIQWEGSALVVDPKGTNANVTAARRGLGSDRVTNWLGQDVHVVDPFGLVQGVKRARFNPLSMINLSSMAAREDIELLADALVVVLPDAGGNSQHFDESAKDIVAGVIAFALATVPNATLMDVRRALIAPEEKRRQLFQAMAKSDAAGGLPQAAAAVVFSAGDKELGAIMTTVFRNIRWIGSLAMRAVLEESDFELSDLKEKPTTVYLVLPPHMLGIHGRFLRLFMNMTVAMVPRGGTSEFPILMIMDEFYSLGPLESLVKASGALAGYGLKLWPFLQNIGQLKELYPDNWQTFFANAGVVQVFGVNDDETASAVQEMLGRTVEEVVVNGKTMRSFVNLMEGEELRRALGSRRPDGLQLVMRSGKPPLLLRKTPYDKMREWGRERYDADPDYKGS